MDSQGLGPQGISWCCSVLCSASILVLSALVSPWKGGVLAGGRKVLDIYLPQQPSPLVESPAALVLDVAVGQLTLCHPAALCSVLECFTITCTWL